MGVGYSAGVANVEIGVHGTKLNGRSLITEDWLIKHVFDERIDRVFIKFYGGLTVYRIQVLDEILSCPVTKEDPKKITAMFSFSLCAPVYT